jgi:hypothetical protein
MQGNEEAVLRMLKRGLARDTLAMYGDKHPDAMAESMNRFWKKVLTEMPNTSGPIGTQPGGRRTYRSKPAGEIEEDTAYAGGMGQGGNAGQSYRKFKPKSAGTFKEDELDEACWKGYHKEGNKKMFGKTYPNCVKNTNEEEQLDEGWKMGILGTLAGFILGANLGDAMFGENAAGIIPFFATMIAGGYFGKDISSVQDLVDRFSKNPEEFKKLIKQRKIDKRAQQLAARFTRLAPRRKKAKNNLMKTVSTIDQAIQSIKDKHHKEAELLFSSLFSWGDPFDSSSAGDWTGLENDLADMSDTEELIGNEPEFKYLGKIYNAYRKSPTEYSVEFANALIKVRNYILSRIQEVQQVNKEQLDEKCWDTHKQVGMKNKGGRQVPNCVPKESAIMKGLKSL